MFVWSLHDTQVKVWGYFFVYNFIFLGVKKTRGHVSLQYKRDMI